MSITFANENYQTNTANHCGGTSQNGLRRQNRSHSTIYIPMVRFYKETTSPQIDKVHSRPSLDHPGPSLWSPLTSVVGRPVQRRHWRHVLPTDNKTTLNIHPVQTLRTATRALVNTLVSPDMAVTTHFTWFTAGKRHINGAL